MRPFYQIVFSQDLINGNVSNYFLFNLKFVMLNPECSLKFDMSTSSILTDRIFRLHNQTRDTWKKNIKRTLGENIDGVKF